MIHSIVPHKIAFKTDTTIDSKTGEYRDPLMRMPMRAMAYTNEVGESLRPLIGEYATLSWIPVLLYVGADIYDKYKNDKTEYSPDSHRFLKQAIFQGAASMLLPLVAVKFGQNLFSMLGLFSKNKLSINTQENIHNLAQQFVKNGNLHAYAHDDKACIERFINIVHSNFAFTRENASSRNSLKKYLQQIETFIFKSLNIKKLENIDKYSGNLIKDIIDTRKKVLSADTGIKTEPVYLKFEKAQQLGQSKNVAIKTAIIDRLSKSSIKGKILKSLGGFAVIIPLIKPIDRFVEQTLINKFVDPRLEKIQKNKSNS